MNIAIRPVEIAGQFWVDVILDGCEMRQHGPYTDADTAEAAARRLIGVCTVLGAVNTEQSQAAARNG